MKKLTDTFSDYIPTHAVGIPHYRYIIPQRRSCVEIHQSKRL